MKWPGVTLLKAQMNTDLLTEDLKKARSNNQSFWLMGQPDVEVRKLDDGLYQVEVNGFDYFDTAKGELVSGGKNKIAMWSLDTDYDERSLFPRQVFFPMAGKGEGWEKLKKGHPRRTGREPAGSSSRARCLAALRGGGEPQGRGEDRRRPGHRVAEEVTLRLLALLWSLLDGNGLLLLEEPELSLHQAVIEQIPLMLDRVQRGRRERRQIMISTHSEALLSNAGIDPAGVIVLEPGREGTLVRHVSDTEASALAAGLSVADAVLPQTRPKGIEQLSLFG
jgi:hypothetical protein